MTRTAAAVLAAGAVLLVASCASGPGSVQGPGSGWFEAGPDGPVTACTEQGDRVYALSDVGYLDVVPGGCQP